MINIIIKHYTALIYHYIPTNNMLTQMALTTAPSHIGIVVHSHAAFSGNIAALPLRSKIADNDKNIKIFTDLFNISSKSYEMEVNSNLVDIQSSVCVAKLNQPLDDVIFSDNEENYVMMDDHILKKELDSIRIFNTVKSEGGVVSSFELRHEYVRVKIIKPDSFKQLLKICRHFKAIGQFLFVKNSYGCQGRCQGRCHSQRRIQIFVKGELFNLVLEYI
jgi:hypothetical protein